MSNTDHDIREGILFIIAAPSGSGKSTICNRLVNKFEDIAFSISYTSRKPRADEINNQHYHFVSRDRFESLRDKNELLEWAVYADNYYGTGEEITLNQLRAGVDLLLDIEVQGAEQVKKRLQERVVRIFILPPSADELVTRLKRRGKNTSLELEKRLAIANDEIAKALDFEYLVINDTLENAVNDVAAIISAERNKTERNTAKVTKVLRSFNEIL